MSHIDKGSQMDPMGLAEKDGKLFKHVILIYHAIELNISAQLGCYSFLLPYSR